MPFPIALPIMVLISLFLAIKVRLLWLRILLWVFAISGVLFALFVVLVGHELQSSKSPERADALWGLTLGITKQDVLRLKGKSVTESSATWSYVENAFDAGSAQTLVFEGDTLTCIFLSGDRFKLPPHRGVWPTASYDRVLKILGTPSRISINPEGTRRILSYDASGALFEFGDGRILGVGVYIPEYGGITYGEPPPKTP